MIVYVVPYLNEYGGTQTFAKTVKNSLKNKFNIQLLDWELQDSIFSLIVKTTLLKLKNKIIRKAKVIHFWNPLTAIGFEKTNFIVSCHGKEILPINLKDYEKKALKNVFNQARAIHVNSQFTKKLLAKVFPFVSKKKISLIYPGIKLPKLKYRKKQKKLIIGTLSRFNPRKNIVNIIRALNILKKDYQLNFKYLLVGKGIEEEKVFSQLRKVRFEWRHLKDISEKEKITKFFSLLDIFVLPTLSLDNDVEGFGIVYLEANSFGIPVIASKVDGVKESVKENISGVFTNSKNPEKIAQSIFQLSKRRRKYRQSARKWTQKFSFKKTVAQFDQLYSRFL